MRFSWAIVGIAGFLFLSLPVRADLDASCDRDFRLDAPGGPLHGMGSESQQFVPNCYAYSASVLLDAWGRSHPAPEGYDIPSQVSSPFFGSIKEEEKTHFVTSVLDYVRQFGVCDESAFFRLKEDGTRETSQEYSKRLEPAIGKIYEAWSSPAALNPPSALLLARKLRGELLREAFPLATELTDTWVARALAEPSIDGALQTIFAQACLLHMMYPRIPSSQTLYPKRQYVATMINEVFNENLANPPAISLNVCANMISHRKDFEGVPDNLTVGQSEKLFGKNMEGCGPHAITVIGRRRNPRTQACEFLIRNSWGDDCAYYRKLGFECDAKTGHFWMPEQDLDKGILGIVYLGNAL